MSILSTFLRFPALRSSRSYTGGGATACVQFPSLLPSAPRTPRSYLWSSLRASQHDSTQRAAKMTPQLREAASAIVRSPEPTFYETVEKPGVTRQVLFVGITCGLVLTFAAVRTTIETDYWTQKMLLLIPHFEVRGPQNATNEYVRDEAKGRYIQEHSRLIAEAVSTFNKFPAPIPLLMWIPILYATVIYAWTSIPEEQRFITKIVAAYAIIHVTAMGVLEPSPFARSHLLHNHFSGRSYTLLTNIFSHHSPVHFWLCLCGTQIFGEPVYNYLRHEQSKAEPQTLESTTNHHFFAFFISAGLFSGLVAHIGHTKILFPRLIARLASPQQHVLVTRIKSRVAAFKAKFTVPPTTPKVLRVTLPNLGASGTVYAFGTMSVLSYPDAAVSIGKVDISFQRLLGGVLLLDVIGVLSGWRMMCHWGHLGGAAFGAMYYAYGPACWRALRELNI